MRLPMIQRDGDPVNDLSYLLPHYGPVVMRHHEVAWVVVVLPSDLLVPIHTLTLTRSHTLTRFAHCFTHAYMATPSRHPEGANVR